MSNFFVSNGFNVTVVLPKRFCGILEFDARVQIIVILPVNRFRSCANRNYLYNTPDMTSALYQTGIFDPGVLSHIITTWSNVINAVRPDIIIAEYAPSLLIAARGAFPTITVGTGFTCPPSNLQHFPSLVRGGGLVDDAPLIERARQEIKISGRHSIEYLPQLFCADLELLLTYEVLDPYADQRPVSTYIPPLIGSVARPTVRTRNKGVFIYSYNFVPPENLIWLAAAASDFPVTIYMDSPTEQHLDLFRSLDYTIATRPANFSDVARSHSVVLSHGGHGTICACMSAGIPMINMPFDLEKMLNSSALNRIGGGRIIPMGKVKPIEVTNQILTVSSDDTIRARVNYTARMIYSSKEDCFNEIMRHIKNIL